MIQDSLKPLISLDHEMKWQHNKVSFMYKRNNIPHSSRTQDFPFFSADWPPYLMFWLSLTNLHRAAAHKMQECYLLGIKKQPDKRSFMHRRHNGTTMKTFLRANF